MLNFQATAAARPHQVVHGMNSIGGLLHLVDDPEHDLRSGAMYYKSFRKTI